MVYVRSDGRLCGLLPLSCVLTNYGAQRASLSIIQVIQGRDANCLPPELLIRSTAISSLQQPVVQDPVASFSSDSYVIVAIVLQALLQTAPSSINSELVRTALSAN